ncbi:MAG TPA: hypothetical protein VMD30_10935 [Tepidisphaeraceae bacterium]|nr:hypothetical protein [Tepidisphaeraceae bacterium]
MRSIAWALAVMAICAAARGAQVVVTLPSGVAAVSAKALAPSDKPGEDGPATPGAVKGDGSVTFDGLQSGTPYDLVIELKDGRVLRGVDLSWYDLEPAKANAGEMTDDDRQQIEQLVSDVLSFYNISRIVTLAGDHDRAVVLVERARTSKFHSDKGNEAIYRMEIWYFKNEFGGWQEVTQENKVLIRKRLASEAQYRAMAGPVRWVAALGGVTPALDGSQTVIALKQEQLEAAAPTSEPADQDNGGGG